MIMGSSVVEQTATGLENSLIDYKILDSNLVQLRLEEPAQNGVTIERSISMTSETVNYFHVWNTNEANYGGYTRNLLIQLLQRVIRANNITKL